MTTLPEISVLSNKGFFKSCLALFFSIQSILIIILSYEKQKDSETGFYYLEKKKMVEGKNDFPIGFIKEIKMPKKIKFNLKDLKIQHFVTNLNNDEEKGILAADAGDTNGLDPQCMIQSAHWECPQKIKDENDNL